MIVNVQVKKYVDKYCCRRKKEKNIKVKKNIDNKLK